MKERRYKEEYRLKTQLDVKTGKPKQIPVYVGDYYRLGAGTDRRAVAVRCLPYLAAFVLSWGAYLMKNSPSSFCIYVLPFACCAAAPVMYAVLGAVSALRAPERMTRVQKETGIARLMRSLLGCCICVSLACLGDMIFMIRNGFAGEWFAAALLLLAAAAGYMGFRAAKAIHNAMTTEPGEAAREAAETAQKPQKDRT